jgi:hypothetical protein
MSSSNPPYPNFNGITYNSSFFPTESGGLTQGQANLLYLRKTVADTATSLETFNAGIATNNLNTTSTASNLVIGSNTNTGTIFINTNATNNTNTDPAIAIGTNTGVRTIKINNGTNSVHCSSIDMAGSGINNVSNLTGDINIGNLQTTGILNLGTLATRSGAINLGVSGGTQPISIDTSSVLNTVSTPAISIGASTAVKFIKIGSDTTAGTVSLGLLNIQTLTSGVPTAFLTTTSSSYDISIGAFQTNGALLFGSGQGVARTGGITFASAPNTACTIGFLTGTGVTVNGIVNFLTGASCLGRFNIFTGNSSAGSVNIATGTGATQTTAVNISSGTTSGSITIGNTNSTTALNGTTTIANYGINAVNRVSNGLLELGTAATNTTLTISRTLVTTTVAGLLAVSEMATANGGLTMGNGKNMILQSATGYATPSLNTELGFVSTAAITVGSLGGGTPVQQATTGTLQLGTYMVFGYLSVNYGISFSAMTVWITEDNTLLYANRKTETSTNVGAGTSYATNLSYVATNTTGPFKLVAQSSSTGTNTVKGNIWAVRIA